VNITIKILNDAMVTMAKTLEEIYCSPDPFTLIQEIPHQIDMVLQEASGALEMVKPEDHVGNTWTYDNGEPVCEGDSCRLNK
jgi:hypothetical protein